VESVGPELKKIFIRENCVGGNSNWKHLLLQQLKGSVLPDELGVERRLNR